MKKIVIFTFAILAILFVARQALLPQLIERGFAKSVSENIGIDRSAALEDGLHIYICGAGSPLPDPKRSGPCIGVLAGKQAFIFDAGTGGSRNLGAMGFPLGQTEQIFLTHLHSDHFDGLGEMLLGTWINGGRTTPTPVAGPIGTAQVVEGFNMAYQIDSGHRTAHHGAAIANPAGFGGAASEIDISGDIRVVLERDDLKITAYNVNHSPVTPAFGYRIDYKTR